MANKTALHEIRVPSSVLSDVRFTGHQGAAQLALLHNTGTDKSLELIVFTKARSYRHREEVHCTGWHVADAYDTLVEVENSVWATEILADTASGWKEEWTLRHFLIYLDGYGAYEVLAGGWEAVYDHGTL